MFQILTKLAAGLALGAIVASGAFAEMVYNRGNSAEPESLDPHKAATTYEANILRDLFEGLVMPDQYASLIPGAAESWTVSDDGTVYTFRLRADEKWSNGEPVTADDFVYSFRRLLDPATAADYASMLYVIANGEAVNAGEMSPETIGVRAVDPLTLEITLTAPTPYFLEMLTHQAAYPVYRASVEAFGADWTRPGNLVSNGPFMLAERVLDDHIKAVRNPLFHDAESVALDVVNYFPTRDASAALKRFEAGEIDTNDDIPTEQLADIRARFGDQIRIGPYLGTQYYSMMVTKQPWSDPRLRRAISLAVDREFLAEEVWSGTMIPAYGMVPPGINGYESYEADYADMGQIEREDEATRLLAELGYGPQNPLEIELRLYKTDNNENTAVAIQEQLRPLGVEVTLLTTEPATHYAHLANGGDFDLALEGWIADYQDPESFLGIARAASGNNAGGYDSPEFERLMDEAAAAGAVPAERMRLLAEAEQVLVDDLGKLPLLFFSYHNLVSPAVHGFEDNVMDVHPSRFISVER